MKRTFIIIFLASLIGINSNAQSVTPPSPNASALVQHANIPVNLYTGVPTINVPLYSLPGRSGSVPVSLGYHANGIKVDQIASSVGIGWALNAGGAITRVVRDEPDDSAMGYLTKFSPTGQYSPADYINGAGFYGYFSTDEMTQSEVDFYYEMDQEDYDSEPDVFYFNFMGVAGKFYLDKDGNALTIPYQDIKIEPAIGPQAAGKWTITDNTGTQYIFGENPAEREKSQVTISNRTYDPPFNRYITGQGTEPTYTNEKIKDEYISSWYLTRVVDPNGQELFSFEYDGADGVTDQEFRNYNEEAINSVSAVGETPDDVLIRETKVLTKIIGAKHVSKINSPLGSVIFTYQDGRSDLLGGKRLHLVTIEDYNQNQVAQYELFYLQFGTLNRLFLDKILQKGVSLNLSYRDFEYFTSTIPDTGHPAVDHWGYSTFQDGVSFPITRIPSYVVNGVEYGNSTTGKDPILVSTQAGTLKKVIYPTGGHDEFEYELNQTEHGPAGGLRIKKITTHDGLSVSNDMIRQYGYLTEAGTSSGTGVNIPVYYSVPNPIATLTNPTNVIVSGQSLYALNDQSGVTVGYRRVEETAGEGKIVYNYHDFMTNPDVDNFFKSRDQSGQKPVSSYAGKTITNLSLIVPQTSRSWERGLLRSKRTYDESGNILAHENYFYETIDAGIDPLRGSIVSIYDIDPIFIDVIDVVMYEINSVGYVMNKTETIVFDQDGYGHSVTTTQEFTYDPVHLNVIETKTQNSSGEDVIVKSKYAFDYNITGTPTDPEVLAIKELQDKNINALIEQIRYVHKPGYAFPDATGATINIFKIFNSTQVYPYQSFALKTGTPVVNMALSTISGDALVRDSNYDTRPLHTFNDYNDFGNLLSETGRDDITKAYTWGHNNTLPLTVTVNAGGNKELTTTYEYQPLVGVIKETDPNGRWVEYRYDEFNRLELVVDKEGKIVSKHEYKLVNEQ